MLTSSLGYSSGHELTQYRDPLHRILDGALPSSGRTSATEPRTSASRLISDSELKLLGEEASEGVSPALGLTLQLLRRGAGAQQAVLERLQQQDVGFSHADVALSQLLLLLVKQGLVVKLTKAPVFTSLCSHAMGLPAHPLMLVGPQASLLTRRASKPGPSDTSDVARPGDAWLASHLFTLLVAQLVEGGHIGLAGALVVQRLRLHPSLCGLDSAVQILEKFLRSCSAGAALKHWNAAPGAAAHADVALPSSTASVLSGGPALLGRAVQAVKDQAQRK